jgi:hypothetical protein
MADELFAISGWVTVETSLVGDGKIAVIDQSARLLAISAMQGNIKQPSR